MSIIKTRIIVMRIARHLGLIIIISFLLLSSCMKMETIPNHSSPEVGIPLEEMNKKLSISSPRGLGNSLLNGDDLELVVDNKSDHPVWFTDDYGVRIFIYIDNEWMEIEDKMSYETGEQYEFMLPPSHGDPFEMGASSMVPYQHNLKKTVPLRVIIIGRVVENKKVTQQATAAYIDLILKPSDIEWK